MSDSDYLTELADSMIEYDLTERIGDETITDYITRNKNILLGAKLRAIDVYKQVKSQFDARMELINSERRRQRAYDLLDRLKLAHKKPMLQFDESKKLTMPKELVIPFKNSIFKLLFRRSMRLK